MAEYWWSIEVLDAELSASRWRDAYAAALIEAAISNGAKDWNWSRFTWGVVFEVAFDDSDAWVAFRLLPAVTAALDATPDPINGLMIYPGRGGTSGARQPRKPRPHPSAGAAEIPLEPDWRRVLAHRQHRDLSIDGGVPSWLEGDQPPGGREVVPAWHPESLRSGPGFSAARAAA
jgi:hypothetical protein